MPRLREPLDGDDGFTMVEVIAAMAVLAIASVGILYGVLTTIGLTSDGRARVVAANLADEAIGAARATPADELDALGTQTWTETVGSREYTVLRSAVWQPRTGEGSPCDSGSGSAYLYKRVSVRVTWPDMGATQPVRSDTLVTPAVGGFDPTRGNLAVKVLHADATPNELATVTVSHPSLTPVHAATDEQGCAFFNQLPAGNGYTATVTELASVDHVRAAAPSAPASVSAGTTTAVPFDYDVAGAARLLDTAGYPVPSSVPVALGHTSLPGGRLLVAGGSWPLTIDSLFPFPAGYRTWLGSCWDADPAARRLGADGSDEGPFWSGTAAASVTPVVSGTTTDASPTAALVDVVVTDTTGTVQPGVQVRAVHDAETDRGCTAGETHVLGTTDADGHVRATLPFGEDWQLSVPGGAVTTQTLHPSDSYPLTVGVSG